MEKHKKESMLFVCMCIQRASKDNEKGGMEVSAKAIKSLCTTCI